MRFNFENFGAKLFLSFATFIFFISLSFTVYYIQHQSRFLTRTMINDGRVLSGILAHNSRIGVFSENADLLRDPVEGVFHYQGVLAVSVFNLKGAVLQQRQKPVGKNSGTSAAKPLNADSQIFNQLNSAESGFYREHKDHFEFWTPVKSGADSAFRESVFLGKSPARQNRPIGFVKLTLDRRPLRRQIHRLLSWSIIIGIVFLVIGSGLSYIAALSITRPLNRLTEGVNAFGREGAVQKVSIETRDEIGVLAGAFNNMAESLQKRERALKESEERLRLLSAQLLQAQEKERKRVAGELHDELGQSLALLKHRIRSVQRKLASDQTALSDECEDTSRYVNQIIENVRRLSRDLRPSILEDLGLSAALGWLITNFQKQACIQTIVEMENIDGQLSQQDQTNIYRILQEALTNISKHAKAGHVRCEIKKKDNSILFLINDDGNGFDVDAALAGVLADRGMGLVVMQERARMLGTRLAVVSQAGQGTTLTLKIPIKKGGMI